MSNEFQAFLTCLFIGICVFGGAAWYNKDAFGQYRWGNCVVYGGAAALICGMFFALVYIVQIKFA